MKRVTTCKKVGGDDGCIEIQIHRLSPHCGCIVSDQTVDKLVNMPASARSSFSCLLARLGISPPRQDLLSRHLYCVAAVFRVRIREVDCITVMPQLANYLALPFTLPPKLQ